MLRFFENVASVFGSFRRATVHLVLSAGLLALFASGANADLKDLEKEIARKGRLPGGSAYWSCVRSLYRGIVITVPGNKIAKKASALTSSAQVGEHPDGFGKGFHWDRKDDEILLVMFINAADPLGVCISGLAAGDRIQVQSAAGIGSFTKDKGNPLASSIVALLAVGGEAATGLSANPELIPILGKAEEFAKDRFKATNAKHKRRDPYGVDPGTGHRARQEGGVLVCLPSARRLYYSGPRRSWTRWLKRHAPRTDDVRPMYMKNAFFLVRGDTRHNPNARPLRGSGQIYVLAFDYEFHDNAGYYKVFMHIKKPKERPSERVIIKKRPKTTPPWLRGRPTKPPVKRAPTGGRKPPWTRVPPRKRP